MAVSPHPHPADRIPKEALARLFKPDAPVREVVDFPSLAFQASTVHQLPSAGKNVPDKGVAEAVTVGDNRKQFHGRKMVRHESLGRCSS
jgi:hypothetical protein